MISFIDRLKQVFFFKLATIYLRYLIGFAFVFASFVKIRGERFTVLPVSNPVGYFFEAMYQTGMYWKFLGWSQLIAGALLMSQRFSTIGAMLFLPVIANVFMITISVNFGMGTPIITSLMLLGTLYLLLWDCKKWLILFHRDHTIKLDLTQQPEDKFMTDPVWTITGVTFVALSAFPHMTRWSYFFVWMVIMIVVGVMALVVALYRNKKRFVLSPKV
ncbi:MAG: hypothetical protein ACOYXT_30100 [Bacteroidota bacterium]